MSKMFDEGGAHGMLLANLPLEPSGCRIAFADKAPPTEAEVDSLAPAPGSRLTPPTAAARRKALTLQPTVKDAGPSAEPDRRWQCGTNSRSASRVRRAGAAASHGHQALSTWAASHVGRRQSSRLRPSE